MRRTVWSTFARIVTPAVEKVTEHVLLRGRCTVGLHSKSYVSEPFAHETREHFDDPIRLFVTQEWVCLYCPVFGTDNVYVFEDEFEEWVRAYSKEARNAERRERRAERAYSA